MARNIGIGWLWIDSLCIIQDDADDWIREASKMADVYSNAYCTIAATGSHGDQEGMFVERKQQDIVTLRYGAMNMNLMITYIDEGLTALNELLVESPLSTRAWTLQERLLSPRMVHFTRSRSIWECRSRFETEDLLTLGPNEFGDSLMKGLFSFSTNRAKWIASLQSVADGRESMTANNQSCSQSLQGQATRLVSSPTETALGDFNKLWYNLLTDYTRRGLTKPSDKLIALSGVAQEVQRETSLRYYAGHWLKSLAEGLCWIYSEEPCVKAVPYRAPSWSWASMDGGITHVANESPYQVGPPTVMIQLIDSSVDMYSNEQIKSGHLYISGMVTSVELVPKYHGKFNIRNGDADPTTGYTEIWLDDPSSYTNSQYSNEHQERLDGKTLGTYNLLCLTKRDAQKEIGDKSTIELYEILVLKDLRHDDRYERIGAGLVERRGLFADVAYQNICLV